MKDHQTYTLEFFNQPQSGLVTHKIDNVTGKPLQGAEFSVKTSDGQLVPDKSGATSSNGRYVTDAEGNIHITGLNSGTYVVEETKTVSGYIMDDKPQIIVVNENDMQTLTFKNTPKGNLTIRKVDSVTGKPLQGVKFKITDSAGNVVDRNEGATSTNGIYTTDENGEISIDNLKPDTYG